MAKEWVEFDKRIRWHAAKSDIRRFLRWKAIEATMFVGNAEYIANELNYLKSSPSWESRWSRAIVESPFGHPLMCDLYPESSGNLIHHAYHLARFEDATRSNSEEMNLVFEFGGGYGSMCRLFYNLGFSGRYVIFDLPTLSTLQCFYLKLLNLPLKTFESSEGAPIDRDGIYCVSDINMLPKLLDTTELNAVSKMLFLATWSLSEVPIELRGKITPLLPDFDHFLFAYQDEAFGVDNEEYFTKFMEDHSRIIWIKKKVDHLPGNNYLLGSS
jgi:hypothetical protein